MIRGRWRVENDMDENKSKMVDQHHDSNRSTNIENRRKKIWNNYIDIRLQLLYKWMGEEKATVQTNRKKWLLALERSAWPVIVAAFSTFLWNRQKQYGELYCHQLSFHLFFACKWNITPFPVRLILPPEHPPPQPHFGQLQPNRCRIS